MAIKTRESNSASSFLYLHTNNWESVRRCTVPTTSIEEFNVTHLILVLKTGIYSGGRLAWRTRRGPPGRCSPAKHDVTGQPYSNKVCYALPFGAILGNLCLKVKILLLLCLGEFYIFVLGRGGTLKSCLCHYKKFS